MRKHLLLAIALLCAAAQGAWAQTEVSTADDLKTAVQTDGANIKLMADIELSSYLNINSRTITIDLNGKTLSRNLESAGMNGHVIWIKSGTLYLKDSSGNNSGKISGGKAHNGGGIYNSGTLYFQGGTITNCRGSLTAGGIRNNGTLYLQGGVITGNHGNDGGGIYNQGTLTISGGKISNNDCSTYGGGVYSKSSSTLTITGGTITNNTAVYGGGGIDSNCNINMSGSVNITGNTVNSSANNIYMGGASTIINVKGALTGSSIGITLESNDRDFTSGFKANNSSAQPSDFFSSDASDVSLKLNGDEAYMSITSGLTYIQRSWEGVITGKVASSTKYLTTGNYIDYDGRSEISDNGWYLFTGTHTYNDRLSIKGDAHFVLQDDCNIEFTKGIYIEQDKTLYIYGQSNDSGKLRATGSGDDANGAIGGNEDQMGGSLVIHGGTVEASSSKNNAAAIGGGDGSSSGMQSVTIYGGTVTATGMSSGAGIGGGQENNTVPSVTIYGGTINATGGNYAAGIGGSEESTAGTVTIYGGTITATGGKDGAGIGGGENGDCGKVYIYGGEVTASSNDYGAGIGGGENGDNGTVYIYGGTVNATGGSYAAGIGGGKSGGGGTVYIYGGDVTAKGGNYGVGIGGDDLTIKIYGGKIHATGRSGSDDSSGPGVGVMNGSGKLYFTMDDGELTADVNQEGISSRDPDCGAGIGGHSKTNVELHVTINGGTINTTGGDKGAGIGASGGTSGGTINSGSEITINGGTVNATGGKGGAGIGSGYAGNQKGTITINGGTVNATGGKHKTGSYEGNAGAGIGGGGEQNSASTGGNGGTIIINGGKVTAKPGESDSGASHPAQAIGHGEADENSGSLTLGNNVSVRDNYGNKFTSENRITECRHHSERVVEVCEHSEKNCTPDGDSGHTINCSYCLKTGSESHNFDTDGHTCKSCGYVMTDLKTITIYEANSAGTDYNSTPTTYSVQYNTTFTLPECSSVPNNMWFAGWKETTTEPASIQAESSEFSSLKAAGTEITVTDDVTYYARYHTSVWPGGGNGTAGDPYLISTEEDWNEFVNAVSYKNFDFGGRYLKLTKNISVTEMVGTSSNRFRGTFDGDGHTLTVSYTTTEGYTAPFRYVDGATIQNLKVAGTITPSAKFAAGIVGRAMSTNTITNCVVDVTINSQVNGDGTHGGIVANINNGTTTISGCVFKGSLLNSSTTDWGGFVGWTESNNSATVSITNSLFIPTTVEGTNGATFARYRNSNSVTITDCYYTSTLSEAQGTQAYTVTNGQPSDLTLNYGSGNNYGTITAYTFDQGDETTLGGLLYDDVLYTGGTTKVTFTPEASFSFTVVNANNEPLTANSDGTYTVTMNNANVTVTAPESNYAVTLYDGTNDPTNSATIAKNSGRKANVTISGRTLYKDGSWNTLCLPFDVTAAQIALPTHLLYGANIMEMDTENSSFNISTNKVSIKFKAATKIEARKPYIVKWATTGTDVDPTFLGSTIDDDSPKTVESADGVVSFTGNYDPLTSTDGLLFDSHNTNNRSFHAALEVVGYAVEGWYSNAEKTASVTSIPFDSDGSVTLYVACKKQLSNKDITITVDDQTWTGSGALTPDVTVKDGNTDITRQCDFAYSDNTDIGTATVTVTAQDGNTSYTGSATVSFNIAYYQAMLANDADNTDVLNNIKTYYGSMADVTLSGRKLYKDGDWNTLCLPFGISASQMGKESNPLYGATIMELDTENEYSGHRTGYDAGTLYLYFKDATTISAGKPYIVKWTTAGDDITSPTFSSVTIEGSTPGTVTSNDGKVSFKGNFVPVTLDKGDQSNLYLGSGNTLYYPDESGTGKTINAFRGYFHVNTSAGVRAFVLNFGDDETTGIVGIEQGTWNMEHSAGTGWYDLSGRKLSGKPTQKGVYIYNGNKRIIK